MKAYRIKNRIWIDGKEGTFLGNGRIQLLEKLVETGSINDAARDLKMSYRKAWSLLESMNSQAPEPYVLKSTGGTGGGTSADIGALTGGGSGASTGSCRSAIVSLSGISMAG